MSIFQLVGQIFGFYKECPIVSENVCSICLNPITEGGRIDCCKHTFCLECIQQWAAKSNHCPECRKSFQYITPCRVFSNEEELRTSYGIDSSEIKGSIPSSRISISDIQSNSRGSGLVVRKRTDSSFELNDGSRAPVARRYSQR